MRDCFTAPDAILVTPPLVPGATHPDLETVELADRLRLSGYQIGLRDLNAEFSFDYVYRQSVFEAVRDSLAARQAPAMAPPPFPARLRPRGILAGKPLARCGFEDFEESAFGDFATHTYYLDMACRVFGLDRGCRAACEPADPGNAFLEAFYREALEEFVAAEQKPALVVLVRASAQMRPALQLGRFLRSRCPGARLLLCLPRPALDNEPLRAAIARGAAFDAVAGPGPDCLAALGASPSRSGAPPARAASGIHGLPLHLYPARLVPLRMVPAPGPEASGVCAAATLQAMKDQYEQTGFDSFLFDAGPGAPEALGALAHEMIRAGFLVQWSALCDVHGAWTPAVCEALFRSGCRYVFFESAPRQWQGPAGEAILAFAEACTAAGLRVNARVIVTPRTAAQAVKRALGAILENHAVLNGFALEVRHAAGTGPDAPPPGHGFVPDAKGLHDARQPVGLQALCEGGALPRLWEECAVRFAEAKRETARVPGEFAIECASRESGFRPAPPREAVALAYLCLESERPEHLNTPLALQYLESYAKRNPAISDRFSFHHLLLHPSEPIPDCVDKILRARPAVAGFSCYLWNIGRTLQICTQLKKASPETTVILGGPEVLEPGRIFRACPAVDGIVRGEGEVPFAQILLARIHTGGAGLDKTVPGLSFRRNGRVHHAGPDFAATPVPDLPTVFTPERVRRSSPNSPVYFETSRGCVNRCGYCSWTLKPGLRNYRLERVENDLKAILLNRNTRSRRMIYFTDAQLNINLDRMKRILRIIIPNNRLGHSFETTINLQRMDREAADLMRAAPFNHPYIGLESIHADTLRNAGRPAPDRAAMEKSLGILRETGLLDNAITSVIIGLPGDNYEKFVRTIEWCWAHDLYVFPFTLMVLPGTRFSREPERFGIRFDAKPPHLIARSGSFPGAEIIAAQRLSVNYVILYNLIKSHGLRFLKANGVGLPAMAAALTLESGCYKRGDFHVLENTDSFLTHAAGPAFLTAVTDCVRGLALAPGIEEIILDLLHYRMMEYSLKRRLRDKLQGDALPTGRYVLGASHRISLKRDIRALFRDTPPDHRSVPEGPVDGIFCIHTRSRRISRLETDGSGLLELLAERLDAPGGATLPELADYTRSRACPAGRHEILAFVNRLVSEGYCIKT